MKLSDTLELEHALRQEIRALESDLEKKRINLEFVQGLVEKARGEEGVPRETFILKRAAMEARSSMTEFSKRTLEAAIRALYPHDDFSVKSLEKIITDWKKDNHIKEKHAADGITGAIYTTIFKEDFA